MGPVLLLARQLVAFALRVGFGRAHMNVALALAVRGAARCFMRSNLDFVRFTWVFPLYLCFRFTLCFRFIWVYALPAFSLYLCFRVGWVFALPVFSLYLGFRFAFVVVVDLLETTRSLDS